MDVVSFVSFVVLAVNVTLGALVYIKNRGLLVNRIFFALTVSVGIWILGIALVNSEFFTDIRGVPLLGARIAFAGASLIAFLFLLLSIVFLSKEKRIPPLIAGIGGIAAVLLAVFSIFSDLVVQDISRVWLLGYQVEYGILYYAFGVFFMVSVSFGFLILWRKLKRSGGLERIQLRYFFAGSLIAMAAAATTNLIVPLISGTSSYSKLGPLFTIVMVAFLFYAIRKHHLLNIRVISTELFTGALLIVALTDALLSDTISEFLTRITIFFLALIFGIFLIRGTLREIRELERLSKAKSDFVSIVSHQLRTPLTAIKGFVSMIKEGSGSEAERQDWLDKAYVTNERMIRLVSDILNISRIERGKLQYNFQEVNIVAMVEDVIAEIHMQAEAKGLALNWEKPADDVPPIRADEEKLRQVILNLIDNAIKYTQKGHVNVRLTYGRELRRVRLGVADTGIGMSPADIKNLFEQFSRSGAGQRANVEGLGLGLYVAKSIIGAHSGKIWAESEGRGKGSRFYVELPAH